MIVKIGDIFYVLHNKIDTQIISIFVLSHMIQLYSYNSTEQLLIISFKKLKSFKSLFNNEGINNTTTYKGMESTITEDIVRTK